jgi:atypical dual specificity phosphatase
MKAAGGKPVGFRSNWETFYEHYRNKVEAKRLALVNELKLDAQTVALFSPPASTNVVGNERASDIGGGRLYVGGASAAQDALWLEENRITHVLNVADEVCLNHALLQSSGIAHRWLGIADHCEFDIREHFEAAFEFILAAYQLSGRILVHCAAGVSRSATIVIAFIMHFEGLCLREALALVREKRPIVYPNKGFYTALLDFEEELFASSSLPRCALELHQESF